MIYIYEFLLGLILTIIIETIFLFIVVRKLFKINKKKITNSILLFLGVFCSFSTIPYLWYILPFFIKNYTYYIIIGEILVVLIESLIYYFVINLGYKRSLIISFICNLVSFLIGTAIIWLIK
jgi:hypothetical protein